MRWPSMALATIASLLFALVTLAGCGNAEAHPRDAAVSVPSPTRWPAAAAGGACFLLEYEVIEQIVGTSFDVSASSEANHTYTCVLQTKNGSYPDLTLAVSTTDADPTVFRSTVQPKGAAPVPELGRIGYSVAMPAAAGSGPGVEVGWLSGNGRLLLLRYRCAPTATAADAGALVPKVITLARKIDQSSV
jgi:hypothetical protein